MNYCDICNSRKATTCIQIYGRDKINMIYSCKSCAKMFADPLCSCKRCTKANKKTLGCTVRPIPTSRGQMRNHVSGTNKAITTYNLHNLLEPTGTREYNNRNDTEL